MVVVSDLTANVPGYWLDGRSLSPGNDDNGVGGGGAEEEKNGEFDNCRGLLPIALVALDVVLCERLY